MSESKKISFSEFLDLILVRLYEREIQSSGGGFLNLYSIQIDLAKVTKATPPNWVFDAGKVLEGRGLANVIFALGGTAMARLTGEGKLYVEERFKTPGIIKDYKEHPGNYVIVSGNNNQVNVGNVESEIDQKIAIEEGRKPAFEKLDQIEKILTSEKEISKEELKDIQTDLNSIREQLKKKEPNRNVLAALLEPLSNIASIAGRIADLISFINL